MKPARKAAVTFIFVTVTLDIVAVGLIGPVLPKLILDFLGGEMTEAANWNGWFLLVFAAMQFFFSPVLGVLSDRVGRRPIILLSNLGLGLDYIVMALAPSLAWLFVGRVISGITASSIPTAMAYIADVSPKEKRAAAFGMIGVAFGLGFILGPLAGGPLGDVDIRLPFWIAAGCSLANWVWGFFFVPESLPPEQRKDFTLKRANPIGSLALLRSHHELWQLATIQFLAYVAHNFVSVWALYAIHRYSWNQTWIGISLAVVGICAMVISGGVTPRMVAKLGERRTLYLGQMCGAAGLVIAGCAPNGALYLASIPIIAMWNVSMPAAQGMMTRRVSEREQGELQGAIASLRSISFLIGPILFSFVFARSIEPARSFQIPGAPYFLASALLFIAMLMSTRLEEIGRPVAAAPRVPQAEVPPAGVAPPDI